MGHIKPLTPKNNRSTHNMTTVNAAPAAERPARIIVVSQNPVKIDAALSGFSAMFPPFNLHSAQRKCRLGCPRPAILR
jgi:hypothetical protein